MFNSTYTILVPIPEKDSYKIRGLLKIQKCLTTVAELHGCKAKICQYHVQRKVIKKFQL